MTIRVLFFGHYRDVVPSGEKSLTLPDAATVADAAAALAEAERRVFEGKTVDPTMLEARAKP